MERYDRKQPESRLQALHDLWMHGGVDIRAPVIRLLTERDRASGHDIEDSDYGRNVWDRLIIAGIWPVELLAAGLVTLLIVAIIFGKRLNFDLQHFRGESWSQGFTNLRVVIVLSLLVVGLMLLAGYARHMLGSMWRTSK